MMLLALLLGLWGARAEECACTGSNEGLPNDSPHQGTSFGKMCRPWDSQYDICKSGEPPKWCSESWCYVKEGCTLGGKVDSKKSTYEGSGLYYSYRVCGSTDYFDNENFEYEFKGCGEKRNNALDLYFAIDASTSIDPIEWQQQMTFLSKLTELGLDVEGDQAGMVTWSGRQNIDFRLGDPLLIVNGANAVKQLGGGTKTSHAMELVMKRMTSDAKRSKNKKVIIMITDGKPSPGSDPCQDEKWINKEFKKTLAEQDITFGILAIGSIDFGRLDCLVEDPEKNIVVMQDFSSFYEYRDPTGDEGLICVDPNLFTEPEIVVDNSCGCRCRMKGKESKKHAAGNRRAFAIGGGSCACKQVCKSAGAVAYSFRDGKEYMKHKDKKGRLLKNCVCFNHVDTHKLISEHRGKKINGPQIMGFTDED